MNDRLGICQWFHYRDHALAERVVELLGDLNVRLLRTGISWADYHRPQGPAWYDWLFRRLSGFDLLVSVWHTPPSLAEGEACNGPPRRLQDYADFLDRIITDHGDRFRDLELWNEPNNRLKWNFPMHDPDWAKFSAMVQMAANWAKVRGKRTVLGGMIPVDPHWLALIAGHGALAHVDVVGIHGFPEMWWSHAPNWDWHDHWQGWAAKIGGIAPQAAGRPIWITETGLATWDLERGCEARLDLQVAMLRQAAAAPSPRVYWYTLVDLDPRRAAIEGFHVDENEYHLGLVRWDFTRKPAYDLMKDLLRSQA